ncbi:NAD(P)H-dependent oxidoreductase [Salinisphaera sp. SPP-AMP-43]|uniref:NADPH-dependent FMN reductase n=1 Tax=Salinisphaera sp. SPP-AMP-43 TaxID=3121288 RepID=UPI003C6DB925
MPSYLSVAVIMGSARYGRRCDAVAQWAAHGLDSDPRMVVDMIDPRALPLSLNDQPLPKQAWHNLESRLERADAFVVVTPEYNHGYPAALKQLIDAVRYPWRAKPAAFVSYGGRSGGIRAIEQLRLVFAELHTFTLAESVDIAHIDRYVDEHNQFRAAPELERALEALTERLHWWGRALREARHAAPYDPVSIPRSA